VDSARKRLWLMKRKRQGFSSQKGQDAWIDTIFRRKERGFFVDLAAADGVEHSNTLFLERARGWSGLLIEPNPYFYEQLVRNRASPALRVCVSDKREVVRFRIDNGQLGGIVADDTDNNPRVRQAQLDAATTIELECQPLTEILDDAVAPRTIDYMSLDVEGAEERVVRGLNLARYTFLALTIERPTAFVNTALKSAGYLFVENRWFDTFYVHETHPNIQRIRSSIRFEQVPRKEW
jgi:FkbM family methyltransferase